MVSHSQEASVNEGNPENRQPVGWVGLGSLGPSDFIPSMTRRKSSGGFAERSCVS